MSNVVYLDTSINEQCKLTIEEVVMGRHGQIYDFEDYKIWRDFFRDEAEILVPDEELEPLDLDWYEEDWDDELF